MQQLLSLLKLQVTIYLMSVAAGIEHFSLAARLAHVGKIRNLWRHMFLAVAVSRARVTRSRGARE